MENRMKPTPKLCAGTQATIHGEIPNWQPWLIFFARALQQQKRRLAAKVEREKLIATALPELAFQIVHSHNPARPRDDRRHDPGNRTQ
jgi:hypothetical protein